LEVRVLGWMLLEGWVKRRRRKKEERRRGEGKILGRW
jgi:hypothetical protein